jgi:hypothetical protein
VYEKDPTPVYTKGVYELRADSLKYCIAIPGRPRPLSLATTKGDGHTLVVLKRVAPKQLEWFRPELPPRLTPTVMHLKDVKARYLVRFIKDIFGTSPGFFIKSFPDLKTVAVRADETTTGEVIEVLGKLEVDKLDDALAGIKVVVIPPSPDPALIDEIIQAIRGEKSPERERLSAWMKWERQLEAKAATGMRPR